MNQYTNLRKELDQETDCHAQVELLCRALGVTVAVTFKECSKHFDDDKHERMIFDFTISRRGRSYSGTFGSSIQNLYTLAGITSLKTISDREALEQTIGFLNTKRHTTLNQIEMPRAYDILACMTWYDPGTFEDFCSSFGYDEDSKKAEKTYNAVRNEFLSLQTLFNDDEMSLMSEYCA